MQAIQSLLPLQGLVVTLRFSATTQLEFFHQPALASFVRNLAGSPENFDQLIRIDAVETGRISYQANDLYRFAVYGLQGSQLIMQQLMQALHNLPETALADKHLYFGRNCRLFNLTDLFSEHTVTPGEPLTLYQWQDLRQEAALWQQQHEIIFHFHSPVRLLKEKSAREKLKAEARYCRQKTDLTAKLIINRLDDYFADLLRRRGATEKIPRTSESGISLADDSHLFWLDCAYTNKKQIAKPMPMGGMTGDLYLQITPAASVDFPLWVLAQYTGFGQRTAFGWGRFQLQTITGELSCRRVFPCQSWLFKVADPQNLISAYTHVESNVSSTHPEYEHDNAEMEIILQRLQKDIDSLSAGRFVPPDLQGFIIEKNNCSRALAVPPFRDRVLQRAVTQALTPAFETLQHRHSYGFRPGRSRLSAKYAIQSAWREGYRWVYESDIDDFFDTVCWQRLEVRLRALWGTDPIVDALLGWIKADVNYAGRTIQRNQGLPQGSPISPMLANLMLDDFDNDMMAAGFKMIRFADDFVVLSKSRAQAEQAHQAAVLSLQEHGLSLNADKTQITAMDRGFHYLGYLFVNDMVLESPKRLRTESKVMPTASAHSWLAKLGEKQPDPIPEPVIKQPEMAQPETTAIESGDRIGHGMFLYVGGAICTLKTSNERLQIHRDKQLIYDTPWRHLDALLLLGNHPITTPALKAALKFNVPVHFCSRSGQYKGVLWHGRTGARGCALWLRQQAVFTDQQRALSAAKAIVNARLIHLRESLRLRQCSDAIARMDSILAKMTQADSNATLNGYEGAGTRLYFTAIADIIPAEFNFTGRNRRPPQDPFNALLSLGYTVLYNCVDSVLRIDGLLPWNGFYHQAHGRHAVLASDLMEPFRHLVERLALSMLKRHELKVDDFYYDAMNGCRLSDTARRRYLGKLMEKFDSKIMAKSTTEPKNLFEHLHEQNMALIHWLEHNGEFIAWQVR